MPTNVLGGELQDCSLDPLTGFYRDGCCNTGEGDHGRHVICARVTEEFLEFSQHRGNDLSTPRPELAFPGLQPGDGWCVCAERWKEAYDYGVAPPVILAATHISALKHVPIDVLKAHAMDPPAEN